MRRALALGQGAGERGEIPIGALIIDDAGSVLAEAANAREKLADPTAHAEVLALRAAGQARGQWRLHGCTLVVTVEPCAMCAGAAVLARVDRVVFGAWEAKTGACGSVRDLVRDTRLNHQSEVVAGVCGEEAAELMHMFFAPNRAVWCSEQ